MKYLPLWIFALGLTGGVFMFATTSERSDQRRLIIVLAGQSNMVGWADARAIPLQYRKQPANVVFYLQGEPAPLVGRRTFGPEVSFAHALAKRFPKHQIELHKFAVNGTSLLAWMPEWSAEQAAIVQNAEVGPLYSQLLSSLNFDPSHPENRVDAFIWMQGEQDATHPDTAANYGKNLSRIVTSLRYDLRSPKAAFILGSICSFTERFPHIKTVRFHQAEIPYRVPISYLVPTDDLSKKADQIHFDAHGEIELGHRFARALVKHLKH
ncbi:MAG: sialate O-acetylesterase [Puniceicoccaceae bacterium]